MAASLQAERAISISTPLGNDVLLVNFMTMTEQLGRPFECELDLLSGDEQIKLGDLLGQIVTVKLGLPGGGTRFFNGHVSRFSQVGRRGGHAHYRATLRPWLWLLTRTADCRIFQEKTVPDIIKDIFREHGFSDFEDLLSADYRTWNYCVQYRETDFNFVSRLMEQEGMYYYFKHQDGKHILVLSDSYSSHALIKGYERVAYYPPSKNVVREEHVSDWLLWQEIQPGTYALNAFDFERPKAGLAVKSSIPREHPMGDLEIYDYPGQYMQTSDGEIYSRLRIEELQARHEQIQGKADARGLFAGGLFELTNFPRADQNREYLITSITHQLTSSAYETGAEESGETYQCIFTAAESKQPYRSPRVTPRPKVQGPQTAVVVGKAGEEIWTDKFGRVKVQFHWDRYGKSDENSSCWVRVSHPWAGKGWGAIALPRIGQEVVVDFLEGDPDRPIITGRVYNGDNMPPYDLPANATQSGVKSRSSKGGGAENFNEIRLEDKKGEEQIYIHAEKNQDIVVENDETHSVGHDRRKTVDNDETTEVKRNRTETVGSKEKITIGADREESVGANESITIGANRTEKVGGNESITITGGRTENVGGSESVTITASKTDTIGGTLNQSVAGGINISTPGAVNISAAGGYTVLAPGGTRTIDSFFTSIGGKDEDLFAVQTAILSMQTSIVAGLSIAAQTTKIDVTGVAFERCGAKSANEPMTIKQLGVEIKNGATGLMNRALTIFS